MTPGGEAGGGTNQPYPDFRIEQLNNASISELVALLQEWKLIHTYVQKLLFSTEVIEQQILRIDFRNIRGCEKDFNNLENNWSKYCEPKSKKLRKAIEELRILSNQSAVCELKFTIDGDNKQYIGYLIRDVDTNEVKTVREMHDSFFAFTEILKDKLNLADVYILQIATALDHHLSQDILV